mgnify:CR=1 FL=1|tara:strand:+ start:5354 stop:6259 length:906 start_codon:yes stop_codon:yes gene_type:complete
MRSLLLIPLLLCLAEPVPDVAPDHDCRRIALIGASVTWGAGNFVEVPLKSHIHREPVDLADVLASTMIRDHEITVSGGDLGFFRTPLSSGASQAADAAASEPTLVLALDFLFWYGYGSHGVDGTRHDGPESRVELLERGLKELERFQCPILVFDYPDMSPAAGIILGHSQIPTPEGLNALNRRLHDWAKERGNVIVLPLSSTVEAIRADTGFAFDELSWPANTSDQFILPDQLHPTTEGTIVLMQMAIRALDAKSDRTDPADYHRDPQEVRRRLEDRMVREAREAGMALREQTEPVTPDAN